MTKRRGAVRCASWVGLAGVLGLAGLAVPVALAHPTGHESRTVADCEKLPTPERQACLKCVQRPAKHHYHPDAKEGERCRPNDGKR